MHRSIRWIYCVIGYTFYSTGGILYFTIIFPLSVLLLPFGKLSSLLLNSAMRMYLAFLTQVFLPLLQIYDIKEIGGFDQLPKGKSFIIIANHRGKLDGPFLLGLFKNTVAVMKLKYTLLPQYSILVKRLDFVSLNPRSRESVEKALHLAKDVLSRGKNLLIFPEGTRTSSKRLLPFKEFAFRIAQETNTDVVPIVIHSDFAFMAKKIHSYFPDQKNMFTIRCLAPIKALPDELPSDMAARVRKIMVKELANIENNSS